MKVSIVIPTHNQERFISKAIDSALNQTYKNLKILVVDDGSTDNTSGILKSYNNKITVVTKKNGGTSDAWNYVLSLIETDYVIGLDSDDEFVPTTVEKTMECALRNPEASLIYSDFVFIDSDGKEIHIVKNPECQNPLDAIAKLLRLHDRLGQPKNFLPFGHVRLYKCEALLGIGGYDTRYLYAEDFDLVLRLAESGCRFQRVPEILYRYRWHETNKGVVDRSGQIEDVKLSVKLFTQRNENKL